jgi:hypothetical protein
MKFLLYISLLILTSCSEAEIQANLSNSGEALQYPKAIELNAGEIYTNSDGSQIIITDDYTSALGEKCKKFKVTSQIKQEATKVTCKNGFGNWKEYNYYINK